MKKGLIFPILLSLACLTGCNKTEANYYLVSYKYNLPNNDSTYTTGVVMKDDVIVAPQDPEAEDYVFYCWCSDKACTKEYKRWGLELSSDITLYAKWEKFEDISTSRKVAGMQEKLKKLGGSVVTVNQTFDAIIAYPSLYDQPFYASGKNVYNRYTDIVVKDYYEYSDEVEGGEYLKYGTEQFYAENELFYDIYLEFEGSKKTCETPVAYDESKEEEFFSLDFQNMLKSCGNMIKAYADKTLDPEKEQFEYVYDANFTKFAANPQDFHYIEGYKYDFVSSQVGWVTYQDYYDITLSIKDNKIVSALVKNEYIMALGEEVQYYLYDESQYDYFYDDSGYKVFDGERLTYEASSTN